MKKIWLMASVTYRLHIRSGTFLILTFGLPALMIIAGAIPFLSTLRRHVPQLGYVDQTHLLAPIAQVRVEGVAVNLSAYASTGEAGAALTSLSGNAGQANQLPARSPTGTEHEPISTSNTRRSNSD